MEGEVLTGLENGKGGLGEGWDNPAYDPDKDLTRLTNEALPNLEHYQDPQNKGKCRPRLLRERQEEREDHQVWLDGGRVDEMSAQYLGDYAVLEADLGGGSGRYLAGHAGDHPVQRGHLVVGLVSHL